ncbi:methyl-accepting chemotaxis protein [Chitinimonas sp. PSY-7]|uniref:CHASE3 domain-containing protein n=1 Tax=Chitinimonas sp. PSY-7 TaxID=3459088 RepID=UPI0040401722
MNWTVGRKIALGYLTALVALVCVGLISYRSLDGLLEANTWKEHTYSVLEQLDRVVSLLKDAETGQRGYLLVAQDNYLEPYRVAVERIDETLSALQALTRDNSVQQQHLLTLQDAVKSKLAELQETIVLRRENGFEAALTVVKTDRGKLAMDTIRTTLSQMDAEERRLLQIRDAEQRDKAAFSMGIVAYGVPVAILLASLVGVLITRNISAPVAELAWAADRIALGDLSPKLSSRPRKDELGALQRAFGEMVASLRAKAQVATQISQGDLRNKPVPKSDQDELGLAFQKMVENLQTMVAELRQGNIVMGDVVDAVRMGSSQVTASADETATATTQLATTIAELRQTTELTSQRMAEVSNSALSVSEVAQSGQVAVQDTAQGMQAIQGSMGVVADRIALLTERSVAISDIVNSVNAVAEQSAILAVNASIEAAHADEHGSGFAAVAQEMKSLALQSKQAVIEVRTILVEIQHLISSLLTAAEQSSMAVDHGVVQSGVAGDALVRMAEISSQNAKAAQQIAVTAMQQAIGVQQITAVVQHIKQGGTDNLASMHNMQQSTQNLQRISRQLGGIIARFVV